MDYQSVYVIIAIWVVVSGGFAYYAGHPGKRWIGLFEHRPSRRRTRK